MNMFESPSPVVTSLSFPFSISTSPLPSFLICLDRASTRAMYAGECTRPRSSTPALLKSDETSSSKDENCSSKKKVKLRWKAVNVEVSERGEVREK